MIISIEKFLPISFLIVLSVVAQLHLTENQ